MKDLYSYDFEDSKYCYPQSKVLINKLEITDPNEFFAAERDITAINILELQENPLPGCFDLKYLKDIHKFIFQDIYEWAGELRTVDISKGAKFCLWQNIEYFATDIFNKLKKENYLINTSTQDYTKRIADYFGEINVMHPFREGNGRVQRIFIENLAKVSGYSIDFIGISGEEMIEACYESYKCNNDKLENLFKRTISPIPKEEQKEFIQMILPLEIQCKYLNI